MGKLWGSLQPQRFRLHEEAAAKLTPVVARKTTKHRRKKKHRVPLASTHASALRMLTRPGCRLPLLHTVFYLPFGSSFFYFFYGSGDKRDASDCTRKATEKRNVVRKEGPGATCEQLRRAG